MATETELFDMNVWFEQLERFNQQVTQVFMSNLPTGSNDQASEIYRSLVASQASSAANQLVLQQEHARKQMELWLSFFGRTPGEPVKSVIEPDKTDRRFQSPEWQENPLFDYLKQYYLLTSRWMMDMAQAAQIDEDMKKKLVFYTKQYVDAMSPSNFVATNPEVLKLAFETKGESLTAGMKNFMEDFQKGRISMTDESRFTVGENLATADGAVVFENDLFQLIQYAPLTETVVELPLLIVPPCINKYYILDLQPENSYVRYAVSQGFTVFLMSWRNIPPELDKLTWDDYLERGVLQAVESTRSISGVSKINTLGFCIGGTLLACALAVLRSRRKNYVASATLLTTMLEYSDVGDISVFLDDAFVDKREAELKDGGIVQGKELAMTFASLRANDLIWFFVVNNYLKGKTPDAFDLLYWNSDGTNLPGPMYAYYLRNMYQQNNMIKPGAMRMCGVSLDLGKINVPCYILATREDHIVPWKTAYASTQYLGGKCVFVLGASGHIAGVVNPASKNKRSFWMGGGMTDDPDEWLEHAESRAGSWWPHWSEWLHEYSGEEVAARATLGDAEHPVIESAPGRYVKVRCD
jgi:polyhydroxyalkanoate synthase subunit PhaC